MKTCSFFIIALSVLCVLFIEINCGRDFYKILKVAKNVDTSQIKKAYRTLAKELHPDRNQDDPTANEKFQDLGAAYEVLNNKEKRQIYDRHGEEGLSNHGQQQNSSPFDLFDDFFGNGQQEEVRRGQDVCMPLSVTLEEAYNGAIISIERVKSVYVKTGGKRKCNCHHEMQMISSSPGRYEMRQVKKCDECDNVKLVTETVKYDVEIEAGIEDGTEMIQYGEGEPDTDGESGDLKFIIRIQKHTVFERKGMDLYSNITISLEQALNGFEMRIPHLDGHFVDVSRKKVTWQTASIRKQGEGFPSVNYKSTKGLLYLTFDVKFPRGLLSEETKQIITSILHEKHEPLLYNGL
uniref:J domain-containing protein n=1 Tax=Rhabditophanes sp. KR3021 TaxID=114890 RepID=A0AC35UIH9_9BILA